MHNVLHRRPLVRHRAHERCQPARLVRDDHGEVHQAPVRRQAALNDTAQRGDVDVAAREDDRNALPLQLRQVPGHQRTDGSRASAFGHHLLLLDEPQHAQADVFLADGDDFVHILARQGKRVRPHLEHRQAISKGAPIGVDANGRTVVQGSGEGGHARRLHPDDLHLGLDSLDGQRHARDEAAAAHRDDNGVQLVHLLQDLHADCARSGQDGRVVVSVDVRERVRISQFARLGKRLGEVLAGQHHVGAQRLAAADFGQRRRLRHDDSYGDLQVAAMVAERQTVVAGRGSHHAAPFLVCRQKQHCITGASLLEAASGLIVLPFQKDRRACQPG
mmetsp:Transcript_39458/g.100006  ORF Transcript_39458/g.100006 Transcript_39458/m.100006 type:complete len:332 (-) Transcript_39458:742-1737(-)